MAELHTALDFKTADAATECLDRLPESAPIKIGSVLMSAAGPAFVRRALAGGHPVFLDLKWHDIPNTVSGAVEVAADLGVKMATVHSLGGREMLEAAVAAAAGRLQIIAVTVLTSHDKAAFAGLLGREVEDLRIEVSRLAGMAIGAGVDGLVCSAAELGVVVPIAAGGRVVVPGIRRAGDARGDQARIATPEAAIAAGATDLVVGRPITGATDPAAAWHEFHELLGG